MTNPGPMIFTDIITFLGRFHPLVVHLPIGFLLMGAAFNVLSYFPNYRFLKDATSFTLLAGFSRSRGSVYARLPVIAKRRV